jgi:putative DNA primase/helicase
MPYRTSELDRKIQEHPELKILVDANVLEEDSRIKTNPEALSLFVQKELNIKIFKAGGIYGYAGTHFHHLDADSLIAEGNKVLKHYGVRDHDGLFRIQVQKEYLNHMTQRSPMLPNKQVLLDKDRYWFSFRNGLYSINEEKFSPHTPSVFTTTYFDFPYEPEAGTGFIDRYMQSLFPDVPDVVLLFQELLGCCLSKDIIDPIFMILLGEGSNGKTVFLNNLLRFFGADNHTSVPIESLADTGERIKLLDKMVNVVDEMPDNFVRQVNLLKNVTGGGMMSGKLLYKDSINFRSYAKFIFSSNKYAIFLDNTEGTWRRIFPIPFLASFGDKQLRDPMIGEKLAQHDSQLFNWILEGWKRYRRNNYTFTRSSSSEGFKKTMKKASDPVEDFMETNYDKDDCNPSTNDSNRFATIYEEFLKWNKRHHKSYGNRTITKIEFGKILRQNGWIMKNSHGNQSYVVNARKN